jgi:hypothetical protein
MQKIIDQFVETLVDSGVGSMLAWFAFFAIIGLAYKLQQKFSKW